MTDPTPINAASVVYATSEEMARNFDGQVQQLIETLEISGGVTIVPAGVDIQQHTITGSLSEETYTEGAQVPLSEFVTTSQSIGAITLKPYRKMTTLQAIQKAGFIDAVLETDDEMLRLMRLDVLGDFFAALGNGTGEASGANLKAALLACENELTSAMEQHGDSPTTAVYFVSRDDYQTWATANDVHSDGSGGVFGLQYIQNLGGIAGIVIRSSFVPTGTIYATASDNLHIYAPDYAAAADGGLNFVTGDLGTIGVLHSGKNDYLSVETVAVSGMKICPEYTNYIIVGTIGSASGDDSQSQDGD